MGKQKKKLFIAATAVCCLLMSAEAKDIEQLFSGAKTISADYGVKIILNGKLMNTQNNNLSVYLVSRDLDIKCNPEGRKRDKETMDSDEDKICFIEKIRGAGLFRMETEIILTKYFVKENNRFIEKVPRSHSFEIRFCEGEAIYKVLKFDRNITDIENPLTVDLGMVLIPNVAKSDSAVGKRPKVKNIQISKLPSGKIRITWETDKFTKAEASVLDANDKVIEFQHKDDFAYDHAMVFKELKMKADFKIRIVAIDFNHNRKEVEKPLSSLVR